MAKVTRGHPRSRKVAQYHSGGYSPACTWWPAREMKPTDGRRRTGAGFIRLAGRRPSLHFHRHRWPVAAQPLRLTGVQRAPAGQTACAGALRRAADRRPPARPARRIFAERWRGREVFRRRAVRSPTWSHGENRHLPRPDRRETWRSRQRTGRREAGRWESAQMARSQPRLYWRYVKRRDPAASATEATAQPLLQDVSFFIL